MVTGGSTLVAASLVAGTGILTPAVAAVIGLSSLSMYLVHSTSSKTFTGGVTLLGGNMIASNMCLGVLNPLLILSM